MTDNKLRCYECDRLVNWLAPDSRCKKCTRMLPEEIKSQGFALDGNKCEYPNCNCSYSARLQFKCKAKTGE